MDMSTPSSGPNPVSLEAEPLDDVLSWFLLNADMETASEEMISSLLPPAIDVAGLNNMFDDSPAPSKLPTKKPIAARERESEESDSDDSSQTETKSKSEPNSKKRKVADSNKSRESAKENRKRQRLRLEALGSRVKALQEENEGLKAHILNVTQRKAEVQKHRMDMERMMAKKVLEKSYRDEPENQEELQKLVQNFRDLYADYGAYRHKEVSNFMLILILYGLDEMLSSSGCVSHSTNRKVVVALPGDQNGHVDANTRRGLLQQPKVSFLEFVIEGAGAYSGSVKANDAAQVMQMQFADKCGSVLTPVSFVCRTKAKVLSEQLKEAVELVKELKVAIERKHSAFDTECGKIEAVCNPKQSVLFLMWVTKNVELLSKVRIPCC